MDPLDLNKAATTLSAGAQQIATGAEQSLSGDVQTLEAALGDALNVAGGEVDRLTKVLDQRVGDILAELGAWRKMFEDISDRLQLLPRKTE